MEYTLTSVNLWPQILTIPICLILLASQYKFRGTKFPKYTIFTCFVLLTLVSVILDLICSYLIEQAKAGAEISLSVLNILHGIYIALRISSPCLFYLYFYSILDNNFSRWKTNLWALFPIYFSIGFVLISCFIPILFYYDENFVYHRTPQFFICYINITICFLLVIFDSIRFRKILSRTEFFTIHFFIFFSIANNIAHYLFINIPSECCGTALSLILIQLNFQKPYEFFDSATGLLNRRSFSNAVRYLYLLKKDFRIGFVVLEKLDVIERLYKFEYSEILIEKIASEFKRMKDINFYRISHNVFCFYLKNFLPKRMEGLRWAELRREYRKLFSKPWIINEEEISLSTKWGIVDCPLEAQNSNDLLHLLEMAKVGSRNDPVGFNTFNRAFLKKIKRRVEIKKIIANAVEKNLFYVVFQPIYNTKLKRFTSAEALVRMHDDFLGYISPDEFIPIAEEEGQILKIDSFVFETVCKFIRDNQIEKLGVEYIEINLSPIECLQDDLAERILKTINKYKIDPSQINLEITETSFDKLPQNFTKIMSCMSRAGIGFSLDDYGTGYSNLSRISELPINIIKVDKSLVQGTDSEKIRVILDSTIEMSKLLGTKVLTEGTETIDHVNYVTERGCDYIQGFYFSKPLSVKDYLKFLEENNK